jgi:electron transport complex protein RnfB
MIETLTSLWPPLAFMGVLGFILAAVLAFANRKLYVQEDPRIDEVEEMLPGTNCGACGKPGCRAFAESCVGGKSNPGQCTVSPKEMTDLHRGYLGVEAGFKSEKIVARLACAGGNTCRPHAGPVPGRGSCRRPWPPAVGQGLRMGLPRPWPTAKIPAISMPFT